MHESKQQRSSCFSLILSARMLRRRLARFGATLRATTAPARRRATTTRADGWRAAHATPTSPRPRGEDLGDGGCDAQNMRPSREKRHFVWPSKLGRASERSQ